MTERERLLLLEQKNYQKEAKKDSVARALRKGISYSLKHPAEAWHMFSAAGTCTAALKAMGGLGDILRANALLKQFYTEYPQFTFDVYLHNPRQGKFLFASLPNVRGIYYEHFFILLQNRYLFSLDTLQLSSVRYKDFNKLPRAMLEARQKIQDMLNIYAKHGEHAWGYIARIATARGLDFMDLLFQSAGLSGAGDKKAVLQVNTPNPLAGKKYITFSTSSNKRDGLHSLASKCWPYAYWEELLVLLKQAYPSYDFIQLGEANTIPQAQANTSFLAKTDLETACAILQGAFLHIDCDCGLVHFAHSLNVPCVALFGPSSAAFVGYRGHENISSPYCGNCWHTTDEWNHRCPLGFPRAECMYSLTPDMVFKKIQFYLAGIKS